MNTNRLSRYLIEVLLFIIWVGLPRDGVGDTGVLLTTITNPSPTNGNLFGYAVAPFGADRLLITAPSTDTSPPGEYPGAVSLFTSNGVLLTTITNPSGLWEESFGASVTGVGTQWVVVGTPYAGSYIGGSGTVYMFNTNGTLLRTLRNPIPQQDTLDSFGRSLAPFGTNALLVGAYDQYSWKLMPGTVHLLDTSGNSINTFTNPLSNENGLFGASMAALGTDRVLIGAALNRIQGRQSGAAYLYHTNGSLLRTFLDPIRADYDYFGASVAALGTDRVIITAPRAHAQPGGGNRGAAFIFSTNGTLLLTITNQAPPSAGATYFGAPLAVSAEHRLLIGGAPGRVYVYSTNGMLLATLPNPTTNAFFGDAAWVGLNRAVVGDYESDIGGPDNGVAYLFEIIPQQPALRISLTSTNTIAVSWPSPSTGWTLQQNSSGISTANWSDITSGILDEGTTRTLVVSPPSGNRFFRLINP
jgi:hypothetical protein